LAWAVIDCGVERDEVLGHPFGALGVQAELLEFLFGVRMKRSASSTVGLPWALAASPWWRRCRHGQHGACHQRRDQRCGGTIG
jgi:hypothetical protein